MTDSVSTRLQRAQRVQSTSTLSALFPLPTATRLRAMSVATSTNRIQAAYNSRGFAPAQDPFDALVAGRTPPHLPSHPTDFFLNSKVIPGTSRIGVKRQSTTSCRVDEADELWTRLGARATAFGGWTDGEGRVEEWSTRWNGGTGATGPERRGTDEDSEVEDSSDITTLTLTSTSQAGPMQRTQSSLSVFHDSFEEEEDSLVASQSSNSPKSLYSTPATSPSVSGTHSRYQPYSSPHSIHAPLSPITTTPNLLSSSPPAMTPDSSSPVPPDSDSDAVTYSFLETQQDSWGLLARVESWLEWPWSSTSSSFVTSPSPEAASRLRRVPSSESLGSDTPNLEWSTWNESGELSSYRRSRSIGELIKKIEWEAEERWVEDSEGTGTKEVGDGLAACVDVLVGLGGFI